jgi:hypothetical protein
MQRVGPLRTGIGVFVFIAVLSFGASWAQSPEESLRARLGELKQWLAEGNVLEAWRPLLLLDQLDREVAKGSSADLAAAAEVLGRFGGNDPGLSMEPFVRVRQAIQHWLGTLPPPSASLLPAAVRAAKPVFQPRTQVDLSDAKQTLTAALERLDAALRSAAPGERDWREFLRLEEIRRQLARAEGPDLTALDAAYLRFASGEEGLGRAAFLDVRNALRHYLLTARSLNNPKVRQQYEIVLEDLASRLEKYLQQPSAELAEEIDLRLDWLAEAGQAGWLVKAVSAQLSRPNVFVEVSAGLIASRVAQPVDEVGPVRDCILKTDIHATGHTKGDLNVELAPSEDQGQFDLVFEGDTATDSVGYRGSFQIYANGNTRITARKRITIDAEKISAEPAVSQADTNTSIHGVSAQRGGCLAASVACRRAEKQRPKAEWIASRHAEQRFNELLDSRAEKLLADANERYRERFRRPLIERRLFPEWLRFSTSARALSITAMQIGEGSLAAAGAPPQLNAEGELAVRVHQSAINNLTASALGGVVLDERRLDRILTESLGAPKRGPEEADPENWAITFARRQPVIVTFGDNAFSVTIQGRSYANEGKVYPGMNVTAHYKIQRSEGGWKAVRQGDLVVLPPGFQLDGGRQLSAREQVLRKVLERRFGKFFEPEMKPKNLVLATEGQKPLELQLTHWETTNGWLLMAWKQVPASSKPKAST